MSSTQLPTTLTTADNTTLAAMHSMPQVPVIGGGCDARGDGRQIELFDNDAGKTG